MSTDRLDFSLWEHGNSLVIALTGRLEGSVGSALRQKLDGVAELRRPIILDLLRVPTVSDDAVLQLLSVLSDLKGKGGELSLLCVSEDVLVKLEPYRNLFKIHPSLASVLATGFQEKGFRWSRRTGFRLTAPVATFLAILLTGWMTTLMILVVWQFRELESGSVELERLRQEYALAQEDVRELELRLKPLADLGLLEMPKARRSTAAPASSKLVEKPGTEMAIPDTSESVAPPSAPVVPDTSAGAH